MGRGVILCSLLVSCADIYTARGVYHKVGRGETLAGLARQHRVSVQELAELNNLQEPADLKIGKAIFIPGVRVSRFSSRRRGRGDKIRTMTRGEAAERKLSGDTIHLDRGRFIWPVDGELSSLYGVRNGRQHDGIDIRASRGTAVRAAADGTVAFSHRMRGYGNLILLKHDGNFFTVYAHNAVNLVQKGTRVKRRETIAKVGSTGRASGPHLHFEVRNGSKPRNPLFFLPKR